MSTNPGVTILPRASTTIRASCSGMPAAIDATLLPAIATSRTAESDCDGSITCPPLMSRSYFGAGTAVWAFAAAVKFARSFKRLRRRIEIIRYQCSVGEGGGQEEFPETCSSVYVHIFH